MTVVEIINELVKINPNYKREQLHTYPKRKLEIMLNRETNLREKLKRWYELLGQSGKNTKEQVRKEIKEVLNNDRKAND